MVTPLPSIHAVVFDMDGLMFNTEDLYDIVGETLLNRRQQTFSAELKMAMMGLPGLDAFAVMKQHCGLDDSVDTLRDECRVIFEDLLPNRIEKMPGLETLLSAIESAEIPKAIATSAQRPFADRALDTFDLQPRFEFVLTAETVERGKPNPDVYLLAAKNLNVAPENMLVLEDSIHGSTAAIAAQAVTVAVPSRRVDRSQFGSVYAICERLDDSKIMELIRNPLRI